MDLDQAPQKKKKKKMTSAIYLEKKKDIGSATSVIVL